MGWNGKGVPSTALQMHRALLSLPHSLHQTCPLHIISVLVGLGGCPTPVRVARHTDGGKCGDERCQQSGDDVMGRSYERSTF